MAPWRDVVASGNTRQQGRRRGSSNKPIHEVHLPDSLDLGMGQGTTHSSIASSPSPYSYPYASPYPLPMTNMGENGKAGEQGEGDRTPLPKLQIAICFWVQMCEALNVTTLFPYMAFFVEDVGKGGPHLGDYVGFLAGCFCLSQLVSALLWAKAADRYGRRPILFLGTLGTGLGMMVFGLARTYEQAVIGRLLSGLLCGNLGVLKAFLTEITDKTNRGGGFAILSIGWSIGTVFSPLIGGMLAKPCVLYPQSFPPGSWQYDFFTKYPYSLPSIVCFSVNVVTAFAVLFFLVETLKVRGAGTGAASPSASSENMLAIIQTRSKGVQPDYSPVQLQGDSMHGDMGVDMGLDMDMGMDEEIVFGNPNPLLLVAVTGTGSSTEIGNNVEMHAFSSKGMGKGMLSADKYEQVRDDKGKCEGIGQVEVEMEVHSHAQAKAEADIPLWRRPLVMYSIGSYGIMCFAQVVLDESLPLLFKLREDKGGFGFDSNQIGQLLSLAGLAFTCFTVGVLPIVANTSKSTMLIVGCLSGIPASISFPMLPSIVSYFQGQGEWPLLVFALLWKNISACLAFTAVTVQVNQSVEDHELTSVNAYGQMMAAFSRAVGPALGGVMWSAWLGLDQVWGNFALVGVVLVLTILLNRNIPKDYD